MDVSILFVLWLTLTPFLSCEGELEVTSRFLSSHKAGGS